MAINPNIPDSGAPQQTMADDPHFPAIVEVGATNNAVLAAVAGILIVYAAAAAAIAIWAENAISILPLLLASAAPIIPALLALVKAGEAKEQGKIVHLAINSRMG